MFGVDVDYSIPIPITVYGEYSAVEVALAYRSTCRRSSYACSIGLVWWFDVAMDTRAHNLVVIY